MYITEEELKSRLKKTELSVVSKERKERTDKGAERLSHEDRVIIGSMPEVLDISKKETAEFLNISAQTVSNASRAITSPTIGIDKELKEDIDKTVEEKGKEKLEADKKIQDQLLTNLVAALGHVGNNIGGTKAVDASKIAVDMSKILDRVSGSRSNEDHKGNRTAIIINVPSMKDEKSYPVINV